MTTRYCSSCHQAFIAGFAKHLCPKCENQSELCKSSRKRGDKEKIMDFNQLLESWKKLRKSHERWRKSEQRVAEANAQRERLELEKRLLLIALSAFDSDQDILRQFVVTKNQLNVMKEERNRLKESADHSARTTARLTKENMELSMENTRLRLIERAYYIKTRNNSIPSFTKEMWRRFTQLCHPDRHENSVASNEATRWLMEHRP